MSEGEKEPPHRKMSKEELLAMTLEDAINISDRFAREPVLKPTGKGFYKSAGVDGLREDMEFLRKWAAHGTDR